MRHIFRRLFPLMFLILFCGTSPAMACTGIRLVGQDGTAVLARSQEWGKFDLKPQIAAYPRNMSFQSTTPDGDKGLAWRGKYGFAGVLLLGRVINTGMNETGLAGAMFFHQGFAEYAKYDPAKKGVSLSPGDLLSYILSNFKTLDEVSEGLQSIRVVPVVDPALNAPFPLHGMLVDPDGESIVIEFRDGEAKIFDNPVGVIANNPTFDWHLTNLRNYGQLTVTPYHDTKWGNLEITPLAAGSGMLGLPGDFTSPSRFVRAAAFVQTARQTSGGEDTVSEAFRILDSFNLPATQSEGSTGSDKTTLPAGTQYVVAADTRNRTIYYHTMFNRRVRKVNLERIDFTKGVMSSFPLDAKRVEDVEEVTEKLR